jgi:periplasmic divalent cation tolerance protein
MSAVSHLIVITTCPTDTEAELLAGTLIDKRLAACVQMSRINSIYRWNGKVESAPEVSLLIKAKSSDYGEIEALIKSIHSYDNPEVVAIPVIAGSPLYLNWIDEETARLLDAR